MLRTPILLLRGVLFSSSLAGMFVLGWWVATDHNTASPTVAAVLAESSNPRQAELLQLEHQVRRWPERVELWKQLLTKQLKQRNLQGAYDSLTTLGILYPDRWQLRLLQAELLRTSGAHGLALQQSRGLLQADPDNIDILQLHVRILLDLGEGSQAEAQARKAWERSLGRDGSGPPAMDVIPYGLLLADVLRWRGEFADANDLLAVMARRARGDARPLIARAMLQQDAGNPAAAQRLLAEAQEISDVATRQWLETLSRNWSLNLIRSLPLSNPPAEPSGAGENTRGQ